MDILTDENSYSVFFERLHRSRDRVLMLDYDGTLSPFTPERDRATPYDGVMPILDPINQTGGTRIVIISGRSVEALRRLLGMDFECEIWGSHGAERYRPGRELDLSLAPDNLSTALAEIDRWVDQTGLQNYVEKKPVGRAFHWRGRKNEVASKIKDTVLTEWTKEVDRLGLEIHQFDGGLELRPRGISKADAVNTILAEYKGDIAAAYLGDDHTDEDAFKALGSRGLKILVRKELRPTEADIRISPPNELVGFLQEWLAATTRERYKG